MICNKSKRLVLCVLGIGIFIFVACNSSAKEINDKGLIYPSEIEIEEDLETITEFVSKEPNKPTNISSGEFVKLISDYSKEWNYKGKKPCVVDFYADWCRPCKMMEPSFAKMAEKYAGKINFYKVNVDYNKDIANAYQITGIPTLFFCSLDGKLIRVVGYQTEEQIAANLEAILK